MRSRIQKSIQILLRGEGGTGIDLTTPLGDPGLFGPDSVAWRVHEDFALMLVGGLSSLMLQALHPLAMAGVYGHSAFREDPLGRFRRTARFIGTTTFASTEQAERALALVRTVHDTVVGTAPDGRPYAASDPALLTWVHVAEVSSFLKAALRYSSLKLTPAQQDQYYRETALIAERLGAENVPKSVAEVEDYFERMRPELEWGEQAKEAIDVLMHVPPPHPLLTPAGRFIFSIATELLPPWAAEQMGISRMRVLTARASRPLYQITANVLRWSLRGKTATVFAGKRARARPVATQTENKPLPV